MSIPENINYLETKFGSISRIIIKEQKWATISQILSHFSAGTQINQQALMFISAVVKTDVDKQDYTKYLQYLKEIESREWVSQKTDEESTLVNGERNRDIVLNDDPNAAWGHYLQILQKKGFENIPEIRSSAVNVMELLKLSTPPGNPIKGAIIGNVQSGKTANMESIISIAADNGWNFFIILSGVIENLRAQTESRFREDLRRKADVEPPDNLRYEWHFLNPRAKVTDFQNEFIELKANSPHRYICVCLKNSKQLTLLLNKLKSLSNLNKMNIIVIDDEADQASVNTKKKTRTTINSRIINLITAKDKDGIPFPVSYNSVNYICYTATPYAILLNERKGLYPGDFIFALTPSPRYIGVDRIFGSEKYEGIHTAIVNIDPNIGSCYVGLDKDPEKMPESMKDCIAWFVCCVSVLRFRKFGKPVSMMMNVDMAVVNHKSVDSAVRNYLQNHREDLIQRCKTVYENETKRLTVDLFKKLIPDYGKLTQNDEYPYIEDYPAYSQISDEVEKLVYTNPSRILLDWETKEKHVYSPENGIHICVDNSKDDAEAIGDESCYTNRLFYPTPGRDDEVLEKTPAFIIIGGNTLSRGLTIENLVATYFQRNKIKQADALLQMGRWFGFRNGYELLPRLWMDTKTVDAFMALSQINEVMMQKIREYHLDNITPQEYSVRIPQVPEHNLLKSLTNRNKMQGAQVTMASFAGLDKEFHKFYDNKDKLSINLDLTVNFLESIESNYRSEVGKNRHLYTQVPFQSVMDYLDKFIRIPDKLSNSTDSAIQWLRYVDPLMVNGVNVVVAGLDSDKYGKWEFGNHFVYKIGRARQPDRPAGEIFIKTVRDKKDMVLDIPEKYRDELNDVDRSKLDSGEDVQIRKKVRRMANLGRTPLLVIYVVSKESDSYEEDVVLLAIHIADELESKMTEDECTYVYLDDEL